MAPDVNPDGRSTMSTPGGEAQRPGASRPAHAASDGERPGSISAAVHRLLGVWRGLPHERRLAALAALGLFISLFLPWYQETVIARGLTSLRSVSASLTGWGAFSFVEAAILLVAAAVLLLLFVRAEGRAFHVPGGDGGVITAAGAWACLLIVWRMFDKEGSTGHGLYETTSGIEWGIFVALALAALMVYTGTRIRLAHEPEPPLPGERRDASGRSGRVAGLRRGRRGRASAAGPAAAPAVSEVTRPARTSRAPEMELEETWTDRPPDRPPDRPTARLPAGADADADADAEPPKPEPTRPRRRRPRSIGAPESSQRAGGSALRPTRHRLDPREIQKLDIAEPPTSRLGPPEPPTSRLRPPEPPTVRLGPPEQQPQPSPEPEDQLTLRLDRPD